MKIAITGATGQLGQLVIQALLKRVSADQIVALVRDQKKATALAEQGVELRHFDYDAPESLAPALQGIDKLLLISANEVGRRTPQHKAVIEAAQLAQVPYIAYTSLLRADTSPLGLAQEHRETEALIQASGLRYTLLRNNWYNENYLAGVEHNVASGKLFSATQNGPISSASRADYAEAAAEVLTTQGHEQKTYELAGSQSFTKTDLATYIAHAASKPVQYLEIDAESFAQGLTQAGLPEPVVNLITEADVETAHGAMFSDRTDLEQLIGRKTTTIQSQVEALFK
ncbi:SDR family oxidoreductase [Acinetobacter cumulans]|uniref:SDR family oxidoreductase n=1 Tax=Acinetobacter cumulans TaxID=2136182 RepID=A0A498D3Y7_9GAMM|nr:MULTISPECIES: SDR family oxidoreductase [Acinetobacter]RKG44450.1 SDR family oxidoreductase [Acinetobacter cumulans]RLL35271.1 SDR family oxidoreductase [Acinetobacter cumulans]RZG58243.1 SDR family oxidoreductase [Acinetobacter sp. WCHAc060006]